MLHTYTLYSILILIPDILWYYYVDSARLSTLNMGVVRFALERIKVFALIPFTRKQYRRQQYIYTSSLSFLSQIVSLIFIVLIASVLCSTFNGIFNGICHMIFTCLAPNLYSVPLAVLNATLCHLYKRMVPHTLVVHTNTMMALTGNTHVILRWYQNVVI